MLDEDKSMLDNITLLPNLKVVVVKSKAEHNNSSILSLLANDNSKPFESSYKKPQYLSKVNNIVEDAFPSK